MILTLPTGSFGSTSSHGDVHFSRWMKDKMKSGMHVDIEVSENTTVLELLACEDQVLLVWRTAFPVLDLGRFRLNQKA